MVDYGRIKCFNSHMSMTKTGDNSKSGGILASIFWLLVIGIIIAGVSYWYFRQTPERQSEIKHKTGRSIDNTAKVVGGVVSQAVQKVETEFPKKQLQD